MQKPLQKKAEESIHLNVKNWKLYLRKSAQLFPEGLFQVLLNLYYKFLQGRVSDKYKEKTYILFTFYLTSALFKCILSLFFLKWYKVPEADYIFYGG